MSIKEVIKKIIPYSVRRLHGRYKGFLFNREVYTNNQKWEKKRENRGSENPDKFFYVIRREPNPTGLLSVYLQSLGKLKEMKGNALLKNYIPIIDLETDFFALCDDKTTDGSKRNAWERYFYNFSDYSVDSIQHSRHVLLSDGYYSPCGRLFFNNTKIDFDVLKDWYEIDKKYFRLLPELVERYEKTKKELFGNRKPLGVMIRDGYTILSQANDDLVKGHPRQPSFNVVFDKIDDYLEKYSFDSIFLVAESVSTNELFTSKYGSRVIATKRDRFDYSIENGKAVNKNRPASMYANNVDYLEEIYLLSTCRGLLAGKCSGSIVAALWNGGKYSFLEIMKLGSY